MQKQLKNILVLLLTGLFFSAKSQLIYKEKHVGINFSLIVSAGTHINQIGFLIRGYYVNNFFQWNNDIRVSYYFKYLGPKEPYPEVQISTGILGAFGPTGAKENLYWNKTGNQTQYQNSIGYAYNIYLNKIKTSQVTGTATFQFSHVSVIFENDILARPQKDRFRTAGGSVVYQQDNWRFSASFALWTGQMEHPVKRTKYPSPAGYVDTLGAIYPYQSHGVFSLNADWADNNYLQQARLGAGIDADQIRNIIQNRFMHDGILHKLKKKNPDNYHFPMIDDKGDLFLYKEGQKVRKPKPYINAFLNPDLIF